VRTQDAMSRTVPHLSVWICKISPCHTMLAYAVDTTGDERYTGRPHRAPRGPGARWAARAGRALSRAGRAGAAGVVKHVASGRELCVIDDVVSLESRPAPRAPRRPAPRARARRPRAGGADPDRCRFATDGTTVLYTKPDANRRPWRVLRRSIAGGGADEAEVYAEADPAFFVDLGLTKDKEPPPHPARPPARLKG
jgi:protease II